MRVRWHVNGIIFILAILLTATLFASVPNTGVKADRIGGSENARLLDRGDASRTENSSQAANPAINDTQEVFIPDQTRWYPYVIEAPFGMDLGTDNEDMVYAGSARIHAVKGAQPPPVPKELTIRGEAGDVETLYIVHFDGEIQSEWKDQVIEAGGVSTENFIMHDSFIFRLSPSAYQKVAAMPFVEWIGIYQPAYKIDPMIGKLPRRDYVEATTADEEVAFLVTLFGKTDVAKAVDKIKASGATIPSNSWKELVEGPNALPDWMAQTITVRGPRSLALELAKIDDVQYVAESPTVKRNYVISAGGILQSGFGAVTQWNALTGGTDPAINSTFYPMWLTRDLRGQHQVIGISDSGIDWGSTDTFALPVEPHNSSVLTNGVDLKVPYASLRDGSTTICDAAGGHGTGVSSSCCQDWHDSAVTESAYVWANHGDFGEALAHEAQIAFAPDGGYATFDAATQLLQWRDLYDNAGANVMNTSWSWGTSSTTYDAQSKVYDDLMRAREYYLITNAAGNDGTCGTWATTGNYRSNCFAKGPVDVGATDDLQNFDLMNTATFASDKGPCWAGPGTGATNRIFPDVVATGWDSTQTTDGTAASYADGTCNNGDTYITTFGGTSGAAPTVAGAVALIHQYFEEGNYSGITNPTGALMKAVLINSAQKMGTSCTTGCTGAGRPGGDEGWGRPSLDSTLAFSASPATAFKMNAWDVPQASGLATSGDYDEYTITISGTTQPLKITLAWTDAAATTGTALPALVNNLNLRLTKGATTYYGNNFTTSTGWSSTVTTLDGANPVECIFLSAAQVATLGTGTATIRVTAGNAPTGGNQGYGLVAVGDIAGQISASLDKTMYVCTDTVSATIYDPGGTPTNAVYHCSDGSTRTGTISGTTPDFTVSSTTIPLLNGGDGETVYLTYTGSDSVSRQTASSNIKCLWPIEFVGGDVTEGDADGYLDCVAKDGTITMNIYAQNTDTITAPGVVGTLSCVSGNCSDITITDSTCSYGDIAGGAYSDGGTDTYALQVTGTTPGNSVTLQVNFTGTGWATSTSAASRQFTYKLNLDDQATATTYGFETGTFQGWTSATQPLSPNNGCSFTYSNNFRVASTASGEVAHGGTYSVVANSGAPALRSGTTTIKDGSFTSATTFANNWNTYRSSTYSSGTIAWSNDATYGNCDGTGGSVRISCNTAVNSAIIAIAYSILGEGKAGANEPVAYRTFIPPNTAYTISGWYSKDRGNRVPQVYEAIIASYDGFHGAEVDHLDNTATGDVACTQASYNVTTAADFIMTEVDCIGVIQGNSSNTGTYYMYFDGIAVSYTGTDHGSGIDAGLDSPSYTVPALSGSNFGTKVGLWWYADTMPADLWNGAVGNVFATNNGGTSWTELFPEYHANFGGYVYHTSGTVDCNNPYSLGTDSLGNAGFYGGDGAGAYTTGDTFSYEDRFDLTPYAGSNVNVRLRFGNSGCASLDCTGTTDGPGISGAARGIYWDDITFYNIVPDSTCATGCTNPSTPTIASVTDIDPCAQSGVSITYTAGSPATSSVLVIDGTEGPTLTGSPFTYNPGNTTSHNYVVRTYNTSSCHTDSTATAGVDANGTPGQPVIGTITDNDPCALGISIPFTAGSGATSHNLYVDGSLALSGVTSPVAYTPANTSSHSYVIRAINGTCYTNSTASAFSDANGTPGAPTITIVNDVDTCAQNGVQVVFTAGSGATSHNLWRDGSLVVTGYTSGTTYNPGDSTSHNYTVYAINGTCSMASNTMAGIDANFAVAAISLTANDPDGVTTCGITLTWTGGTGATQFNLYVDGAPGPTNITSGYVYTPGDVASHSYVVRGLNGACYTDSNASAVADPGCGGCAAPTQEVIETVNGKIGFNWTATDAANYRVVRGLQTNLPALITSATDFSCYAFGASTSVDIQADDPSGVSGRCYYYLIQGYNCADPDAYLGPAGPATAGARQVETPANCD